MANTPPRATPLFLAHRSEWMQREDEILAGKRIPTIRDRRRGHSAFKSSPDMDAKQLALSDIDSDIHDEATVELLKAVVDGPTAGNCYAVYLRMGAAGDEVDSYLWHAALRGLPDAVTAWASDLMTSRDRDRIGHMHGLAVAMGMLSSFDIFPAGGHELDADDIIELRDQGMGILRRASDTMVEWDVASDGIENPQADPDRPEKRLLDTAIASMAADSAFLRLVEEDRAESACAPTVPEAPEPPDPGMMVMGAITGSDSKHKGEMARAVAGIAGKRLPLAGADRVFSAGMKLHEDHPHLAAVIDRMMLPQIARPAPLFRVLLVGPLGAGKTTFGISTCEALELPYTVFNAGGVADGAIGGTSSQYSSHRLCLPMQMIGQHGVANPVMLVDEIDKIASGKTNGSVADVLLGMLEPTSARRYFDPALEVPVDLSAVSWIFTANSLEDVPQPLRDRLQIIRVPEPGWEHVGQLSRRILDDLARSRGLDRRWIEPLAPDELEIVHDTWPGGSIRRLRKILEVIIDVRDLTMGVQ